MNKVSSALGVVLLGLVAIMLIAPTPARAQAGATAVPWLLIAPTSRISAMGEAGTGWVDDASAIFWNPGALAFQKESEVSLTHANWLPKFNMSDLFYDYLNFKMPVEAIDGVVSASVTYLNLGKFTVTNESGPTPIGEFKSYEYAVTAGYSTLIGGTWGLGFNLRFIHSALSPIGTAQEQGNGISSGVSFDVATMWRPQGEGILKGFSLGVNLSNVGPKITYIDAAQADPLPTNLRVGLGYTLLDDEFNHLQLAFDANRTIVKKDSTGSDPVYKALFTTWGLDSQMKRWQVGVGAEYWYGSPRLLALRAGYFSESKKFGGRNFATFGAGVRYDIFGLDFSYIAGPEDLPLSDTIRFSVMIGWGGAN
jgi:hypothetical protein